MQDSNPSLSVNSKHQDIFVEQCFTMLSSAKANNKIHSEWYDSFILQIDKPWSKEKCWQHA